ncbi:histone-lysine N-methyltransferase ash1 isoform X2 [Euwallacea similis]|uniref:histone-lysine N-methyltransferase ash1 isoform X2 n=1 Tax=Euwallacea similis TaxID=1736056 RepID=UPI00344E926A
MAANDGATTELFTGWSSVVHQPEDEPEESDLPSTVDIGALSAEPPQLSQNQNEVDSDSESEDSEADSSNSDASDGSQESCSHSGSSDSDSSSTSQESSSRSPSPEFSVTSSQTNGLRLTIATVRKNNNSPINTAKKIIEGNTVCKSEIKKSKDRKKSTSSSSSNCSSDSDVSDDSDDKCEVKIPRKQQLNAARKAGITTKLRPPSQNNGKNMKEQDRGKQSPLVLRNRMGVQKDCPVPRLKLSSSSSSVGSHSKDKDLGNRERDLNKARISIANSNTNNLILPNIGKDHSTLLLPKLRSSSSVSSGHFSKEKDTGSTVIGKLRSSSSVGLSVKEHTLKDKEISKRDIDQKDSRVLETNGSGNGTIGGNRVKEHDGNCEEATKENGKGTEGKGSNRRKIRLKKKSKKMASLPLSRSSTYSTSDSESSDDLLPASCSLQEIRQEDLAAILPDQSECNDFNDFDQNHKDSPETGDLSGSDMELPQQAINSLIQRTTESSSDGEGHQLPNPQTLFANSLLQQFVPNNPLLSPLGDTVTSSINDSLSPPKSLNGSSGSGSSCQNSVVQSGIKNGDSLNEVLKPDISSMKRGRGRPKRVSRDRKLKSDERLRGLEGPVDKTMQDFCGAPNVSPDSGIQNSPEHSTSPEPPLSPNLRLRHSKEDVKRDSATRATKMERTCWNPLRERHSERILSQDKHNKTVSLIERTSRRNRPQQLCSSSRNSSQDNSDSSKTLSSRKLAQIKEYSSSRNSSRDKLSSRNSSVDKVKETVSKHPVTSNQFDRLLYGKGDRVLYPPRRKAGRPVNVRKPGRPPKSKAEAVDVKRPTTFKSKGRSRLQSVSTLKPLTVKSGKCILKVPKILHSKHKHKHKKRKFKILKPVVTIDPKINQEIEKLIIDFVKYCVIGAKQPKDSVPEQILKTLKKVTKKRRMTDYMEKKKKKQSVSAAINKTPNSNDQCLPLKKRHYHLVSNSNEAHKLDTTRDEKTMHDSTLDKIEDGKGKSEKKEKAKEKENKVLAKSMPLTKGQMNNNEYEVKSEKPDKAANVNTKEATELSIIKIVDKKPPKNEGLSSEAKALPTTPKKRHRLENLNPDSEEISIDTPTLEIKTEVTSSVLDENTEKVKSSITVQSFINELKVKRNLLSQKSVEESCTRDGTKIKDNSSTVLEVQKTVPVSPESTKKKVRKRRAYNRTGFPTVKKKKKKTSITENIEAVLEEPKTIEEPPVCDRVPKEGEEINEFLERSSANNSMQDLSIVKSREQSISEDLSECESLPEDERIDYEGDDCSSRSESVLDGPSGSRTPSDAVENETLSLLESSIERLRSRLDQKKRKRSRDLINLPETSNTYPKRRRREDSPASSIEPLENRLRDNTSVSGDELSKRNKKIPRWRKKYLVAGLFSKYYKEDERAETSKAARNCYNPEEHPFGLLPAPLHCGKHLRRRKVDFLLPYDLWWQHTHSQLPGRDVVPSWNYKKIRTNIYNVKSNGGACEPQSCNCKNTSNCSDDCINRLVYAECPPSHRCLNQRIQKHDWAPGIEKFMTEDKGWGVRTKEPIKQGEFILEYVGEVVSDQEFKERMNSIYVNDTHHYCLHLDTGLVIDGHRMGSYGRFVNHSCQPNCEMQKWSVNGQLRMALFALRDIESYEELSYDYNFSLFNPAEGQPCKCGSEQCRGVIGGKTQRVRQLLEASDKAKSWSNTKIPGRVGRPRKTEAKKKACTSKDSGTCTANHPPPTAQVVPQIQVKPMSHQQKCFILEHHCFLLRNLTKVRKVRDRSQSVTSNTSRQQAATPTDTSSFMNQLNALQKPRNMKTRKIAQAEDNPELNKTIKLAAILKSILGELCIIKGDTEENLSSHLQQLPSKRKVPEFYLRVQDAIDLSSIEQNVATGVYKTPEAFDQDMNKLFSGFSKFYGRTTTVGIAATKLRKVYNETKQKNLMQFQNGFGSKPPLKVMKNKKKNEDEEDIIRCICGIPRDEGLMIQCERCMVWQHIECVKVEATVASYHCEVCVPRPVDYEIPMDDFTEHGHRYYMTLMRGDLQLRQGDTVYVLRDISIQGTNQKHSYETIGKIDYSELDIFRIERLWKDKDSGNRFAYGHHYLRPHETFHEPTRKFFPNEVMRVPLYEAVPVELVMEHCWVMDINTFCKGRPVDAKEEHVYICEYRVDKGAKMFSKVAKSKFPTCTKNFAFERFESRLKISRTYCPHEVDESLLKNGGVGRRKMDKDKPSSKDVATSSLGTQVQSSPALIQKTPAQQKSRLNKILLNLLGKIPTRQVLDVSYLLEGGRRRKKQETKQ